MITGKNESKLFVKHVTCDYRCTLYGKKSKKKVIMVDVNVKNPVYVYMQGRLYVESQYMCL